MVYLTGTYNIAFLLVLIFSPIFLLGQISEDFSDGDFTSNPVWTGDVGKFQIAVGQLNTNGVGTDEIYLSTVNELAQNVVWEFVVDIKRAPSSSNRVRIYLIADRADLTNDPLGYFIEIGQSGADHIKLRRSDGNSSTTIFTGSTSFSGDVLTQIRVTREAGMWSVDSDLSATSNFNSEGETVLDQTYMSSSHFGILVNHTSSAVNDYYFDDFSVSEIPDNIQPEVTKLETHAADTLILQFNESVSQLTAENTSNYSINEGIINSVKLDTMVSRVILFTAGLENAKNYEITLNGLEDISGNQIMANTVVEFQYLYFSEAQFREVVINEILADPLPSQGLPESDFVEILNTSDQYFDLKNWTILDAAGSSEPLPSYSLAPNSYLILCNSMDSLEYTSYGNVLGVVNFPNFNSSSSDSVIIKDGHGAVIDEILINAESQNGVSIEQVNPNQVCSDIGNFVLSASLSGGTPGTENSLRELPAGAIPKIIDLSIEGGDSVFLAFSEAILEESLNQIAVSGNKISSYDFRGLREVVLIVENEFVSEMTIEIDMLGVEGCSGEAVDSLVFFYYDISGPILSDVKFISESEMALIFHEPLRESTAEIEEHYLLNDSPVVSAQVQDSSNHRVHVTWSNEFVSDSTYRLQFEDLKDTLENLNSGSLNLEYLDQISFIELSGPNTIELGFKVAVNEKSISNVSNFLIPDFGNPASIIQNSDQNTILLFSDNFPENKSLDLYIEHIRDTSGNEISTPAKVFIRDTQAPEIDSVKVRDERTIDIFFDEPVAPLPAININNYHFDPEETIDQVQMLQESQVRVILLGELETERKYILELTEISDSNQNAFKSKKVEVVFDSIPPTVLAVDAYDSISLKVLLSEPPEYSSLINSYFQIGKVRGELLSVQGPDSISAIFGISPLEESDSVNVYYSGFSDHRGNQLLDTLFVIGKTWNPVISDLYPTSNTEIFLRFSKEMDSSVLNKEHYYLAHNSIESVNRKESAVIIKFNETFNDDTSYQLEIQNLTSTTGLSMNRDSTSFIFWDYLDGFEIIQPATLELDFSTEFDRYDSTIFSFPLEIKYGQIDLDNPSIIRLVLSDQIVSNTAYELRWSNLFDRWGRRIPDHGVVVEDDQNPPDATLVNSDYFSTISVLFDENLNDNQALRTSDYWLETGLNPKDIVLDGKVLELAFDTISMGSHLLYYRNIEDRSGNFVEFDSISFSYSPPYFPKSGDLEITEIMVDPNPSQGLPEIEYLEIRSKASDSLNLKTVGVFDSKSFRILENYWLKPKETLAISSDSEISEFGGLISSLPTFDNDEDSIGLMNVRGELLDVFTYNRQSYRNTSKSEGGFSLSKIDDLEICGQPYWSASFESTGGSPGVINNSFDFKPDTIPPKLLTQFLQESNLFLEFDEQISKENKIEISSEYFESISYDWDNQTSIHLEFLEEVLTGTLYEVSVGGLTDCFGNRLTDTTLYFGIGADPELHDILITEIMVDPNPVIGLPETEYVEILNNSSKLLSLGSLVLGDDQSQSSPLGGLIQSGERKLLLPKNSFDKYSIENKIPVDSWVSLDNNGQLVTLKNKNEVIHQVAYSGSWNVKNPEGGRSLELGSLNNPCKTIPFWSESTSPLGGTPGLLNSYSVDLADKTGPKIEEVYIVNPDEIKLQFDEPILIDTGGMEITLDPFLPFSQTYSPEISDTINLKFFDTLQVNESYEITVASLEDCVNNLSFDLATSFLVPDRPQAGLVISEILFDPVLGGVDFVELFNNSNSHISLEDLEVANETDRTRLGINTVISPGSYLALCEDPDRLLFDYPNASKGLTQRLDHIPSMNNDEGTLVILYEGEMIDSIYYRDDFHHSLIKHYEGVSLERISFLENAVTEHNWQSASSWSGFATPGYENSNQNSTEMVAVPISVHPKLFLPESSNPNFQSFTTIDYQMDVSGLLANVNVYDALGNNVKTIISGQSLSNDGFFTWDGTDNSGSRVRTGTYLVVLEVYGESGTKIYKETVVVGRQF